jgi:serine/threonine-protein kinase
MTRFASGSDPDHPPSQAPARPSPGGRDSEVLHTTPYAPPQPSASFDQRATAPDAGGDAPARPLPARVGKYQVLAEIARGGMGVVLQAQDTALNRVVALKMMHADVLGHSAEGVRRFHWEAQAAARLAHPNIVPIYERGDHEGQPYFAMPFVAGGSLAKHLERYTADPRAAAVLVQKVARAVQHAHDKGILHRDLKPSNVLLDERGEPLVSDFGLAKLQDADMDLTSPGSVVGTPAYMAPEQAAGRADLVGAATDVWALGVMLFELLTARRPFPGPRRGDVLYQIRAADPPRPRALRPGLDRNLETITLKCLEKEPARRYPSAGALADDLGCWLRGEPIRARPQRWPARVLRAARRRPTLLTAAAITAAFAVVLAVVLARVETDPAEATRRNVERQLAAGKTVSLLGPSGLPGYYRPQAGYGGLTVSRRPGNPLVLESVGLTLIELVADPQRERYEYRADVYDDLEDKQEAGLYFLHSACTPAEGTEHYFGTLTLSRDRTPREALSLAATVALGAAPPGVGAFTAAALATAKPPAGLLVQFQCRRFRDFPVYYVPVRALPARRLPPSPTGWRRLTVRITPEAITAACDREVLGVVRRPALERCARILTDTPAPGEAPAGANAPPPAFAPRGALGLFAIRGSACYRQIVIEPLP